MPGVIDMQNRCARRSGIAPLAPRLFSQACESLCCWPDFSRSAAMAGALAGLPTGHVPQRSYLSPSMSSWAVLSTVSGHSDSERFELERHASDELTLSADA